MIRLRGVRVLGPDGLSAVSDLDLPLHDDQPDLDASGCILSPGLIDLHAHLRDPGFPAKETLDSGALSAAAGGFTHIVAMANTAPVTDSPDQISSQVERVRSLPIQVSFAGALTRNLEGQALTDAADLKAAGAVALSDDGRHAVDTTMLEEALRHAARAGLPVLLHAQYERLAGEGVMDDSTTSRGLRIPGIPREAEIEAVRDALDVLRRVPGARLHLQHVSTVEALDLIARAKAEGLAVTAEVTPHHLTLTSDAVVLAGPTAKVNPPLRTAADVAALRQALEEGVIDCIATDHAPHEEGAKQALSTAAFGIAGFETALPVVLSLGLPWSVIHRACIGAPAAFLQQAIPSNDWILIDPNDEWTVDPAEFRSRGRNNPWAGRRVRGRVRLTVAGGRIVHRNEVFVG